MELLVRCSVDGHLQYKSFFSTRTLAVAVVHALLRITVPSVSQVPNGQMASECRSDQSTLLLAFGNCCRSSSSPSPCSCLPTLFVETGACSTSFFLAWAKQARPGHKCNHSISAFAFWGRIRLTPCSLPPLTIQLEPEIFTDDQTRHTSAARRSPRQRPSQRQTLHCGSHFPNFREKFSRASTVQVACTDAQSI
jgi:hypothetical protein